MDKCKNVVFLDYDGVVNTLMWDTYGRKTGYNFESDGKVNNFQACQWVSHFCNLKNYMIVVTSTWRKNNTYAFSLRQGGLRDDVVIHSVTAILEGKSRADEILHWLKYHPWVENYVIFDDENCGYSNPGCPLGRHFILCDTTVGFMFNEFNKACDMHDHGDLMREPNI